MSERSPAAQQLSSVSPTVEPSCEESPKVVSAFSMCARKQNSAMGISEEEEIVRERLRHLGTSLHAACMVDSGKLLALLLDFRADLHTRDLDSGATALHVCCMRGGQECMELLLQYDRRGSGVVGKGGGTSPEVAAVQKSSCCSGSETANVPRRCGKTAASSCIVPASLTPIAPAAASARLHEMADYEGRTALFIAAFHNQRACAERLVEILQKEGSSHSQLSGVNLGTSARREGNSNRPAGLAKDGSTVASADHAAENLATPAVISGLSANEAGTGGRGQTASLGVAAALPGRRPRALALTPRAIAECSSIDEKRPAPVPEASKFSHSGRCLGRRGLAASSSIKSRMFAACSGGEAFPTPSTRALLQHDVQAVLDQTRYREILDTYIQK